MRKNKNTGKRTSARKQWFRKWIKQLFASFLNRQDRDREEILAEFQELKELIEKVNRDLTDQRKRRG